MPHLDRSIVEHQLPIKPGYRPFKQAPRRFNLNMLDDIMKETERDLNKTTPMDGYPMPIADMLVDAAVGHKVISFMDGNAGYNQIFMAEKDIAKTAFESPAQSVYSSGL